MKVILSITLFFITQSVLYAQQLNIDSLENVISTAKDTTKLNAILRYLAVSYYQNPEKCKEYQPVALAIAKKHKDKQSIAFVYHNKGITHAIQSEIDSAEKYFKRAIDIEKTTAEKIKLSYYLADYAYVFKTKGNFDKATAIYFDALKIAEEKQDDLAIGKSLYNIANVHYLRKDYENALIYFKKSLTAYDKTNKEVQKADIYAAFGSIYEVTDSLNKSLEMYAKALKIYESENANFQIPLLYHNRAVVFLRQKKYRKAIEEATKSVELFKAIGNKDSKIDPLTVLVEANIGLKNFNDAAKYFSTLAPLVENTKDLNLKRNYYISGKILANAKPDYKKAFEYSEKLAAVNDSLFKIEQEEIVHEINTKYEIEKKEQQLTIKEKENKAQKAEIKNKNLIIVSTLAIFVLLAIIGFVLYKIRERNIKHKHEIELNKQRIESQEQTLKEVASELHSGLGSELNGLIVNLQAKDANKNLGEEIKRLKTIYQRFRKTSHILALPSFLQSTID